MRILQVIHRYYPYMGGSESYIQDVSERLVQDGHEVTVLTTDAWDFDHFWSRGHRRIEELHSTHNGVRIHRSPIRHLRGTATLYPRLRKAMGRLAPLPGSTPILRNLGAVLPRVPDFREFLSNRVERFDVVHITNVTFDFLTVPAARFATKSRTAMVFTPFVHLGEPLDVKSRRAYTMPHQLQMMKDASSVVVQTTVERDFLRECGVPEAKLRTIGCWVKPEELVGGSEARFRELTGIRGPIVLSIGAAAHDKGTFHTVEAMERLWAEGQEATLVIIASTVLKEFELFLAAMKEEYRKRIVLLRSAPHSVKLDALAAADLFLLPSRTDSFGIVFLEAWTYGLPVVGARAGGVPDVIADGQDGLLVDFGDVAGLYAAVRKLLSEPDFARRLGERGRTKVEDRLWLERKYPSLLEVYEEAASRTASWRRSAS